MNSILLEEHWVSTPRGKLFARSWTPSDRTKTTQGPIMLFHDSLGSVELWRDFPAKLSKATGLQVIAYDRLGFGLSSVHPGNWSTNFIREEAEVYFPMLRAAFGFDRFFAYGYSVGGAMAASCAALNLDTCDGVITQSAQAFVDQNVLDGIRRAKFAFGQEGQIERLAKYHGTKASWVLSAWIDTWLSEGFANWRIEQTAPHLMCPLLVIHGDQDEYGSLAHPNHILALTSGKSEMTIIENCHHAPHREYPEQVLKAVSRFLSALT